MSNVTPCASSVSRAPHQSPVSFGRSKIVALIAEAGAGVFSLAGANAVEIDSSPYAPRPAGLRAAPIISIKTTAEESLNLSAADFFIRYKWAWSPSRRRLQQTAEWRWRKRSVVIALSGMSH